VRERARRIAHVLLCAVASPTLPKTTEALCATVRTPAFRISPRTLRAWCEVERTTVQALLDFVHVLRAVIEASRDGYGLSECLDVSDPRTVANLLRRGALAGLEREPLPSVEAYCVRQRYITNRIVVNEVLQGWLSGAARAGS